MTPIYKKDGANLVNRGDAFAAARSLVAGLRALCHQAEEGMREPGAIPEAVMMTLAQEVERMLTNRRLLG